MLERLGCAKRALVASSLLSCMGFGLRLKGLVFRVQDLGFWVQGLGLGVLGSRFRARFSQFMYPLWARI